MNNRHTGSGFDSWLKEVGIYGEVTSVAIKHVLARQISDAMREQRLSKSAMALRMATSRSSLDRLLDPQKNAVSLQTLTKAAQAVGWTLRLELV